MDDSDPRYTQACSEKTIQSDSKGFFGEFYNEIYQTCGQKWITQHFGKLKTDEERILSLYNDSQICDPVLGILENVKPVYKEKDAVFSAQRRLQAEKLLLTGDLEKALMLANQAVIRAPAKDVNETVDFGTTLALAYWSRASILLQQCNGERALSDLKLATLNGLKTKHNPEFYLKTAKAYALNGEDTRAKIALGIVENLVHGDDIKIQKFRQELSDIAPNIIKLQKPKAPELSGSENEILNGASNLVELKESPDKGKYIAAKENIKTGDIVLRETPVAACLLPTMYGSHCLHCFERLVTPVSCPNCSGIGFCSNACMTEACSTYHKYECKFLDLFMGSGMSILCYIAIRIFTQAKSLDDGLSVAHKLIETLCMHPHLRQPEDFLKRTLMTTFLLRCLQKAEFFGRRPTENAAPTVKELQVAAAILGLLQLLQFNAHEIYETVITDEHRYDKSKIVYIGAGLYRTGCYFNHDCCPGVARFFCGKTIVLACTKPLQPGEPVSENYGPIVIKMTLKERQRSLRSRYWFKCTCDACTENWPVLEKLDKNVRFRCTSVDCKNLLKLPININKDVRCNFCRKNISLKESIVTVIKAEELYREAAAAMKEQLTEKAIELFKEGIDLFHQVAALPHKDTLIAKESLRACFADTGTTVKL